MTLETVVALTPVAAAISFTVIIIFNPFGEIYKVKR